MTGSVLITGGSGLLAVNWALAVRDRYAVTLGLHQREIRLSGVATTPLDLESETALRQSLEDLRPGLVVHTAGLTSVEECEADPDLARRVNTELAQHVALACARLDLPLVHISTDHLGAGDAAMVDETAPVQPLNMYAHSKAEAETRVLEAHSGALVVRTNFFGWGTAYRRSFSDLIIDNLRAGEALTLFEDVFYTPILIGVLVRAAHDLVAQGVCGIVNLVGDERVSKYDFGRQVARSFDLDAGLIRPGSIEAQDGLVRRPLDMSLSNQKATRLLGRQLGKVAQQLDELVYQESSGMAREVQNI